MHDRNYSNLEVGDFVLTDNNTIGVPGVFKTGVVVDVNPLNKKGPITVLYGKHEKKGFIVANRTYRSVMRLDGVKTELKNPLLACKEIFDQMQRDIMWS